MSSFSVGGLSTGIDYNDLISKLIEVKRQPINILEDKKTEYNSKITGYSDLTSRLASLKSAVDKLKTSSNFYVKDAAVDDSTVLDASASGTASVGNYSVSVTSLASEEKEAHSGLAASSTVVNSSGSDQVFAYTYGATTESVTVADGTTLAQLVNLINDDADNPGVAATLVNDGVAGDNYRLILTGDDTGADNTIVIDDGSTTLDGAGGTENFTSSTFTENKTAADADFSVDGLQIHRSSNQITDVISGVTLDLKKAGSSATISVTADTEAIKEQIEGFVSAYNSVVDFLSTNMDYDSTSGESGILSGEGTARNIGNSLRDYISGSVSGLSGELSMLSEIGITTDYETGQLEIDSSILDEKLGSNLDDIAEMFKDTTNGIAIKIYDYIGDITSSVDGSITLRKDGLQDVIDNIDDSIKAMELRLDQTEDTLVHKFTQLEMLVSGYNTIGNFLTNFYV